MPVLGGRSRCGALLSLALALSLFFPPGAAGALSLMLADTEPPTSAGNFVTRDGTFLRLDGSELRFTGINIYNANSDGTCGSELEMAQALVDIGPGKTVIRAWFFQGMATVGGVRDWTRFDETLAAAEAVGVKVIPVLANQWADCEQGYGFKTKSWYQTGYQTDVDPDGTVTYRDWVAEVVDRYKDNSTVAFWQLINEAEVQDVEGGDCGLVTDAADTLKGWAEDVSGLVKSIDSNHLVSLGTIGGGQCGTQGAEYQMVHDLPTIDICEFHDYEPGAPIPGDEFNGLGVRIQQCHELNKPIFVGEVGIRPNQVGGTFQDRADAFSTKLHTQIAAGVQGFVAWAYTGGPSKLDDYDIGAGDPALDALTWRPSTSVNPPEFGWVTSHGGPGPDDGNAIAIDSSGNVLTAGFNSGGGDFDPGPGTLVLDGYGAFVAKQNSHGNLLWAFTINGERFVDSTLARSIATDAGGNVIVTGSIVGTVDFDPSPALYELSAHDTRDDAFLAKYDPSGSLLWARVWGGPGSGTSARPTGVAVDSEGNIVVTGMFQNEVDLDPDPVGELLVSSVNDSQDAFVSKFDAGGNLDWAVTIGGASSDRPEDVGVDAEGNIYSNGFFDGTVDFDPDPSGTTELTSARLTDADSYIWKLDPSGDFVWARRYGSVFDEDDANAMTVDSSGNVYAAAQLRDVIDFDHGPGLMEAGVPGPTRASYVWKVDSTGQTIWAAALHNNSGLGGFSEPLAIAVDSEGVVLTGVVGDMVDFDPGPGQAWISASSSDAYLWGLDHDGDLRFAFVTGGQSRGEIGGRGVVARSGVIYVTGFYGYPIEQSGAVIDFDPDPNQEHPLTSEGHHDVFVWRLGPDEQEPDSDGDGIGDGSDNCVLTVNPDQGDLDGDGFGDVCDPDIDDDGIANTVDLDDESSMNASFSDGAGTFGTIVQSDLDWLIDAASPGISISVSGSPTGTATFRVCTDDFEVTLNAGDSVVVTCGSLTITVISGDAIVALPGIEIVISVGSGATAYVERNPDGSVHIVNAGATGDISVTEGGELTVLSPGESHDFGLSPRAIKGRAAELLSGYLPTGDKQDDKILSKAVDSLIEARAADWWVDDSTLDPKQGSMMFNQDKQVVGQLLKVRTVDVTAVIDDLVTADAALAELHVQRAEEAITEAKADGAAARDVTKAQKELDRALLGLIEAAQEVIASRPDKAIAAYGKAWERAQKAMEALG